MSKKLKCSPVVAETSMIDQLPDDVLVHIVSFLPNLLEISRTSVLSRRWRNLWHNVTCLDFDVTTLVALERLKNSQAWYIECVNKVIDARIATPGLPSVKKLRIIYTLGEKQGHHINRWIEFAAANQVETLHLDFDPYASIMLPSEQFKLSEETWRIVPSGLSNIKCLKSLNLSSVNVTKGKEFIEFILLSCPLLEDLSWEFAGTIGGLDVSGAPPLQLKRLKIEGAAGYALTKLCAPYLTSLYYDSTSFKPEKIDVPMLTDLTIGSRLGSAHVMKYLHHFQNYIPQLEKLYMITSQPKRFKFKQIPELVKLKYLKMHFDWGTDCMFHQILKFIKACPLLETFAFQVIVLLDSDPYLWSFKHLNPQQKWNEMEKNYSFEHLKVLELYGAEGRTVDQKVIKCIIDKSPNLEKLLIDTNFTFKYHKFSESIPEVVDVVKTKAKELCQGHPLEVEIVVI